VPIQSDPNWSKELERVVREFESKYSDPNIVSFARRLAEAHLDVSRVRLAKHMLWARMLDDPSYVTKARRRERWQLLQTFMRESPHVPLPASFYKSWAWTGRVLKRFRQF
jgi:hypothetical protein